MKHTRTTTCMATALLLASACACADDCPLAANRVGAAGPMTLKLALESPDCRAVQEAAARRYLAVLPSWRYGGWTARFLPLHTLARSALGRGDRETATVRLAEWRAVIEEQLAAGDESVLMRDELRNRIAEVDALIRSVRAGTDAPAAPVPPAAPWIREGATCGTPAMAWSYGASISASAADAWLAQGRPDIAVKALLAEQWVAGMQAGIAPPRLRQLAELAFGADSYERDVARALAGVRLDPGAQGGARASLSLFGMTLPVPVGTARNRLFASPDEVASYVRPMLLHPTLAQPRRFDPEDWARALKDDARTSGRR